MISEGHHLMPKYSETTVTSKKGINFVKTVIESAGCIFHKIEQENDLGIDAIVELAKDGLPLCKQIGVQIKSGQSFYNAQANQCLIPVSNHFEYWSKYPLSVCGIVYIPALNCANWVDIKRYLKQSGPCATIRFNRTKLNAFESDAFVKFFIPTILKDLPKLSFDEAAALFHSTDPSETHLGLVVLFHIAPNDLGVWDWFIDFFKSKAIDKIPPILVYYFAHIPWHGDIAYSGEGFNKETKAHVQKRFGEFNKQDIVKLLSFIDDENGIARRSLGQSVEAIVSSLPNRDDLLLEIVQDDRLAIFLRECAALIYAYHFQKEALPILKALSDKGSWYAGELLSFIQKNGWIDPYA
jgi:hypothetical protein